MLQPNTIGQFLKKLNLEGLSKHEQLTKTVQSVAAIPWEEGRTIEEVLQTKMMGTCTGKHLLLQACLDKLGIPYEPVVCTFRWDEQGITYPDNLRSILEEGSWEHGHNFVHLVEHGIDIDVTWDPALEPYGFRCLPENWDGMSSFISVDNLAQRWDGMDIATKKKELIAALTPKKRERRERFLKGFIEWIDSIHAEKQAV